MNKEIEIGLIRDRSTLIEQRRDLDGNKLWKGREKQWELLTNEIKKIDDRLTRKKLFCMTGVCTATPIYSIEGDGNNWSLCRECFEKYLGSSMTRNRNVSA